MRKPTVAIARRACEAVKADQAIVFFFSEDTLAAVSYGITKSKCTAVKSVCDEIFDAIADGRLPLPGEEID